MGPTSDLPSWQGPGSLGPGGWFLVLEPRDEMNPMRGDRDEFSWGSALWGKRTRHLMEPTHCPRSRSPCFHRTQAGLGPAPNGLGWSLGLNSSQAP